QQRMPVEERDVPGEVFVEITTGDGRQADRVYGVDTEGEHEQDECAQRPVCEPVERRERARCSVSHSVSQCSCSMRMLLTAGLRRKWMSCGPASPAGRN